MLKNLSLSMLAFFASLITAEIVLRALDVGDYSLDDRVLYSTLPLFKADDIGAVYYEANTAIRMVAVYGNQVDYDVITNTNNLGFFDSVDYDTKTPGLINILFVGDSFTAGSGGFPWVPKLRHSLFINKNARVYNLGVGGTGPQHFDLLLSSIKRKIILNEVNIMLISNDLMRSYWKPIVKENGVWLCPKINHSYDCSNDKDPMIRKMEHGESVQSLVKRASKYYVEKQEKDQRSWIQHLRLYTLACEVYGYYRIDPRNIEFCPHLKNNHYNQYQKHKLYYKNIKTLNNLSEKYPETKFRLFHIPEKGETILGKYFLDIQVDLVNTTMEYIPLLAKCHWEKYMYHKHDSHPNMKGYTNILGCVEKLLSF